MSLPSSFYDKIKHKRKHKTNIVDALEIEKIDNNEDTDKKDKEKRYLIYIRHGEDTSDGYKHDQKLTSKGKEDVKNLTIELINEYGLPDIIYYSPYYRTRQTKKIMLKVIHKHFNHGLPEYKPDFRLSRYFTKHQKKSPNIRRETEKRGVPIDETWKEFKSRVNNQLIDTENLIKNNEKRIIWCITHTLVLDRIIKLKGIDHDYEIPFLDKIVISV